MEIIDKITSFALGSAAMKRRATSEAQLTQLRRLLARLREEGAALVACACVAREIETLQRKILEFAIRTWKREEQ